MINIKLYLFYFILYLKFIKHINNSYLLNRALGLLVNASMETIKLSYKHFFSLPSI